MMVQIHIEKGQSLQVIFAQILRENGLHIIKVHRGVVTHYGKLERVRELEWVQEGLNESKKSGKVKSNET